MDNIKFSCAKCHAPLEARHEMKGRTGKCPECGEEISVPQQSEQGE